MTTLRRLATASVIVTYLHLVFGGLVRITGSGMGCGDHWPKCNGSWIPPFENATVLIEYTHRLLAALVLTVIAALTYAAWRRRAEPGVGGRGGVLNAARTALALVIAVALLGMVTVKLGNRPGATVAHWTLAMTLIAVVIACAVRAGGFRGDVARAEGGTPRAARSLGAAAAMAFIAVVLGGLVAKTPGAGLACPSFPMCGDTPVGIATGAAHLQLTHRIVAYLLVFHVLAVTTAITRRAGESAAVKRTARNASALVLIQLVVGAAMVQTMLRPSLRSMHEAVGIGVWMETFLGAYISTGAATARKPA